MPSGETAGPTEAGSAAEPAVAAVAAVVHQQLWLAKLLTDEALLGSDGTPTHPSDLSYQEGLLPAQSHVNSRVRQLMDQITSLLRKGSPKQLGPKQQLSPNISMAKGNGTRRPPDAAAGGRSHGPDSSPCAGAECESAAAAMVELPHGEVAPEKSAADLITELLNEAPAPAAHSSPVAAVDDGRPTSPLSPIQQQQLWLAAQLRQEALSACYDLISHSESGASAVTPYMPPEHLLRRLPAASSLSIDGPPPLTKCGGDESVPAAVSKPLAAPREGHPPSDTGPPARAADSARAANGRASPLSPIQQQQLWLAAQLRQEALSACYDLISHSESGASAIAPYRPPEQSVPLPTGQAAAAAGAALSPIEQQQLWLAAQMEESLSSSCHCSPAGDVRVSPSTGRHLLHRVLSLLARRPGAGKSEGVAAGGGAPHLSLASLARARTLSFSRAIPRAMPRASSFSRRDPRSVPVPLPVFWEDCGKSGHSSPDGEISISPPTAQSLQLLSRLQQPGPLYATAGSTHLPVPHFPSSSQLPFPQGLALPAFPASPPSASPPSASTPSDSTPSASSPNASPPYTSPSHSLPNAASPTTPTPARHPSAAKAEDPTTYATSAARPLRPRPLRPIAYAPPSPATSSLTATRSEAEPLHVAAERIQWLELELERLRRVQGTGHRAEMAYLERLRSPQHATSHCADDEARQESEPRDAASRAGRAAGVSHAALEARAEAAGVPMRPVAVPAQPAAASAAAGAGSGPATAHPDTGRSQHIVTPAQLVAAQAAASQMAVEAAVEEAAAVEVEAAVEEAAAAVEEAAAVEVEAAAEEAAAVEEEAAAEVEAAVEGGAKAAEADAAGDSPAEQTTGYRVQGTGYMDAAGDSPAEQASPWQAHAAQPPTSHGAPAKPLDPRAAAALAAFERFLEMHISEAEVLTAITGDVMAKTERAEAADASARPTPDGIREAPLAEEEEEGEEEGGAEGVANEGSLSDDASTKLTGQRLDDRLAALEASNESLVTTCGASNTHRLLPAALAALLCPCDPCPCGPRASDPNPSPGPEPSPSC